jgi:hypothetical protein
MGCSGGETMRIVAVFFIIMLTCSCRHTKDDTQDNTHPGSTEHTMTRNDEVRKIMRNQWIHEYETGDFYWWSAEERKKNLSELHKMEKDYYYESSDPNLTLSVPGPSWSIRGPLTIAQVEQESLEEIRKYPDVPQVPFGYENDKWDKLKSQYKDGDEFYFFSSNERSYVFPHGTAGYVLIRDNQVAGLKVTVAP